MENWDLSSLKLKPRLPEILSTTDSARAIALDLAAGEELGDHQVHERAWVLVVDGEVEVSSATGQSVTGGPGLLIQFPPAERHAVSAISDVRLLLLLTPWPGKDHPGAMTIQEKLYVRRHAAKRSE